MSTGETDYDCAIVASNRIYDAQVDPGFFTLEVVVQQVVLVKSTDALTNPQVRAIVETGFSRGTGGRVRFRSLLQPDLGTIENVEVLEGSLSPPQAAPSAAPSVAPTAVPSVSPTDRPTGIPSAVPSAFPTVVVTTLVPSAGPILPVDPVTLVPTSNFGVGDLTESPTDGNIPLTAEDDRQPLVLGAIAGGLATIFVSCFFVFCVWFPCCKRRDEDSTEDDEPRHLESGSSSESDNVAATMIPGVVNVSAESASLADSTLGDQTAIVLLPPKKKLRQASPPRVTQSLSLQQQVSGQDSFDESSLYTTTTEPEKVSQTLKITKLLPDSLNNTLDFEDDIIFPMSGSGSESEPEKETTSRRTTPRAKSSMDMSESTRRISNVGGIFDDTDDDSFTASSPVESDEEKAKAISHIIDQNTKGFDPFAEDSSGSSSFAFDQVEPIQAAFFGLPSDAHDDHSSQSNTTASTKDVERLLLGSMKMAETHTYGDLVIQDHLSRSSDGSPSSKAARGSPRQVEPGVSDERKANNVLLRTVLEDAQSLSRGKSPTAQSRASRKSAPSRLAKNLAWKQERKVPTEDLLADHHDFGGDSPQRGRQLRSSMSVGAHPLPRDPKDQGDSAAKLPRRSPQAKARSKREKSMDDGRFEDSHLPYRSRYLDHVTQVKPHNYLPPAIPTKKPAFKRSVHSSDSDSDSLSSNVEMNTDSELASASSASTSVPPSPSGYLGAEPRDQDQVWNMTSEDSVMHMNSEDSDLPDTPASSPGLLGIAEKSNSLMLKSVNSSDSDGLSNPWLFDVVEQTLGPRSAAADMESISGRSSRSGRSQRSSRSRRSRSRQRGRARASSSHSRVSRDSVPRTVSPTSTRRSRDDPSFATSESNDLALEPKNLEHDLKRLQLQLADVLQSEMDQVAGSGITVSTAGDGSKTAAKNRKKKKKRKIIVVVPPGKLGIVLSNRNDGKGTIVAEVRPNSTMRGMVAPGDKIVGVDEQDVTKMTVNEITSLMANRSTAERRLTFVSTSYSDAAAPGAGSQTDQN